MRRQLWPEEDSNELERELSAMFDLDPPYRVWVADDGGNLIGFIEIWVRSYAEGGPPQAAAYVEGIWVAPGNRLKGVGRALFEAAERWARSSGYSWIGSDALIDNEVSHAWHRAVGLGEVERLVVFGKPLS